MARLAHLRALVTGGTSGIGLAVAEQAASQGAKVVIASSNAERVQKAIKAVGGEAKGQAVDVSDEGAVETFFAGLGAFDHLVFTAGDSLHCTTLQRPISNRPDGPLNCGTGLRLPQSNTEAHIFVRAAPLSSQLESPGSARTRDGWLPRASAGLLKP